MNGVDAYPLTWPAGWPRAKWRESSNFDVKSFAVVRDRLMDELRRYDARDVILSTNIPLRRDGLPYANVAQPKDVGVAIYFKLVKNGQKAPFVFACDKWLKIEENIHAIFKTIDALRGIARWGSSDLLERAFTGFTALPLPAQKRAWYEVLGVNEYSASDFILGAYRELMMKHHPDRGGDHNKSVEINEAYSEFRRQRGIR